MKYIINTDDFKFIPKTIVVMGVAGCVSKSIDDLEELNADYINEHFSDLQDEAYKKGFEDGKAVNDKGCEGCKWEGDASTYSPCERCCNCYHNEWAAKDDKIEVGDIVERYLDGKLDSTGLYLGDADENGDYWNCLFWTGVCFVTLGYPKNQLKKTDKHCDISSILKEMQS